MGLRFRFLELFFRVHLQSFPGFRVVGCQLSGLLFDLGVLDGLVDEDHELFAPLLERPPHPVVQD